MMSSATDSISVPLSYLSLNSSDIIRSTANCAPEVDPIAISPAMKSLSVAPRLRILSSKSHFLTLPLAPDIDPVTSSPKLYVLSAEITDGADTVAFAVPTV